LLRQQPEPVGPVLVVGLSHGAEVGRHRRAVHDEAGPVLLDRGHVLDQATEGQLAHRRALPRLLVVEVPGREAQEVPGLGQRRQQVRALTGQGRGVAGGSRGHELPPFSCLARRLSRAPREAPSMKNCLIEPRLEDIAVSSCPQCRAQSESWRTQAPAPCDCSPSCRTTGSGPARNSPRSWASPPAPCAATWTGFASSATRSPRTPAWTAATSWPRGRRSRRSSLTTRRPSPWRSPSCWPRRERPRRKPPCERLARRPPPGTERPRLVPARPAPRGREPRGRRPPITAPWRRPPPAREPRGRRPPITAPWRRPPP